MFKPLELYIGLRYTRAKRRNHFISFISATSIIGIALGVAALITVVSVMNGFQTELRERILGMTAHLTISEYDGPLRDWRAIEQSLVGQPGVVGAAPYVEGQGMLMANGRVSGSMIRGVLPDQEPKVSEVAAKMMSGALTELRPGEFGIVLGRELAYSLGVTVGDKVTLVTPSANVSIAGISPRLKRFTVVGVFRVGMQEYDSSMALIQMEDAQRLFRTGDGVSGVRVKTTDIFQAPRMARQLADVLPAGFMVNDWTQSHANFFRAVKIEKTMMFVILSLIVAVAAFMVLSTLVMVVTDKESDIAILRTLGATPRSIMFIFITLGTIIGVLGTLLGLAGGVTLALNIENIMGFIERVFHFSLFPADVYYVSRLPAEIHTSDVVTVCCISFALTVLATLYPAWRAARTQPAEALRYE